MKCSCGADNLPNAKFCKACGSKIEVPSDLAQEAQKPCPSCQASLKSDAKFCNKCGYKFGGQITEPIPEKTNESTAVNDIQTKQQEPAPAPEATTKICASCGANVKVGAKFCASCGKSPDVPLAAQIVEEAPVTIQEPVETKAIDAPVAEKTTAETTSADTPQTESPSVETVAIDSKQVAVQTATVKLTAPTSGSSNKKIIIISAVSLAIIGGAIAAWFTLRTPAESTTVIKTESAPSSPVVAEENKDKETLTQHTATPEASKTTTEEKSLAASLIGKTVKPNNLVGEYYVHVVDKTKSLILLNGVHEVNGNTKLILVTDLTGKVIDSKDVSGSNEDYKALIDGKKGCLVNKKPYPGIYALSYTEKLTPPAAVWKLSEEGKLIDQTISGLECAVYVESSQETGDFIGVIGHNIKFKQAALAKPKAQTKLVQPAAEPKTVKSSPQQSEQASATQTEPVAEPTQTQQQEAASQEDPKKKRKNSIGGFFEKLGESVKKGATESECTSAQRAMNQCNN